jgi:hypothetical protein
VFLFAVYGWMVAVTHPEKPELNLLHSRRREVLGFGVGVFAIALSVSGYEAYAESAAVGRLIEMVNTAEKLKSEIRRGAARPAQTADSWRASVESVLEQRGWRVCLVNFRSPEEGLTYVDAQPSDDDYAWNDINRRVVPLRGCIDDPH